MIWVFNKGSGEDMHQDIPECEEGETVDEANGETGGKHARQ